MDKPLVEGTFPGSVVIGNVNGWITFKSFLLYVEHF
jgi:hypothetical protein